MITIKPVSAFFDNYIWLIINETQRTAAIVDPGDASPVLTALAELELTPVAILVTHHHPDHINGIRTLMNQWSMPVYGPAREAIPCMSHPLQEGDHISLPEMNQHFRIFDLPGHTAGHIAYYDADHLFIGDTLFMAGCGRLKGGTAEQLYHSLNRVAKLPNETLIYCTHEYTRANLRYAQAVEPGNPAIALRIEQSDALREKNIPTIPGTLACEKTTNPFLRTDIPEVIQAAENFAGHRLDSGVEVFTSLRKWKDQF